MKWKDEEVAAKIERQLQKLGVKYKVEGEVASATRKFLGWKVTVKEIDTQDGFYIEMDEEYKHESQWVAMLTAYGDVYSQIMRQSFIHILFDDESEPDFLDAEDFLKGMS